MIVLATTVGLVLHGAMYGPQAAFFSELFGTRVRYTGLSVGWQLSSIAAGAVAPLIAIALFSAWGSTVPVSLYVAAMCADHGGRAARGPRDARRIAARRGRPGGDGGRFALA